MDDPLGAFIPNGRMARQDIALGPLADLTFAAKDLFAVTGVSATCGHPDWAASHPPAANDAPAVKACLDSGATLVGRTIMDELAYSLSGQNPHYGTPTNPNAPGRTAGGSSSGSAAAVAGGAADFALGTDTGGSVRVPASYCGLYGLRPTHGVISLDGVMPLAPSLDTVGWFARDAAVLRGVGEALLGEGPDQATEPKGLMIATDAFGLASDPARAALEPWVTRFCQRIGGHKDGTLADATTGPLTEWLDTFRNLQAQEAYESFAGWMEEAAPRLGPEMAARWTFVTDAMGQDTAADVARRQAIRTRLEALTADGWVVAVPSAPDAAPLIDGDPDLMAAHRQKVLSLTAPAGLAGLPQISMPLATVGGMPIGLGLIGPRGSDHMLLTFAENFAEQIDRDPGARFDG